MTANRRALTSLWFTAMDAKCVRYKIVINVMSGMMIVCWLHAISLMRNGPSRCIGRWRLSSSIRCATAEETSSSTNNRKRYFFVVFLFQLFRVSASICWIIILGNLLLPLSASECALAWLAFVCAGKQVVAAKNNMSLIEILSPLYG